MCPNIVLPAGRTMALPDLNSQKSVFQRTAWQSRTVYEIVDAIAADDPDREAACDQTRRLSYGQLVAESNGLARFLLDSGIAPGDCVAIQSPNAVELAVAHLACSRAGATFVPLSEAWRQTETRHLLEISRARMLLVP